MKFGKFEIDGFVIAMICFIIFVLGTAYVSQFPDLKAQELKFQQSKEQELKYQVELKELELKILEEKNNV